MIQMFAEPISGTHKVKGPVMILGVFGSDRPTGALAVDGDGVILDVDTADLNIDWRFDFRMSRWVDVGPFEVEDADGKEEADGWGEAVPGEIPGAD